MDMAWGIPVDDDYIADLEEVLVDRSVPFLNEAAEEIAQKRPAWPTMESILQGIPEDIYGEERRAAVHKAMVADMLRYREEVEAPAMAIVRERKASSWFREKAVKKVAVAFSGVVDDEDFYREALEGIEPVFLEVAKPRGVVSLALRVSWAPGSALYSFPPGGFISSAHHNILALVVGPYRPGLPSPGFYLVYDVWQNAISVIPQLPTWSVNMTSHFGIGTGVAVLRHGIPSRYVLAELLLRKNQDPIGLTSTMATIFLWWSSGPLAGRWIQREVLLPLPQSTDEHMSTGTSTFHADTVFAVGSSSLCWVDLLQGVLMCDDFAVPDPQFRFVALPLTEPTFPGVRQDLPERYRSMCCIRSENDEVIKFVSFDTGMATLTTWILQHPSDPNSKWNQHIHCYINIPSKLILPHWLPRERLIPCCPVPSILGDDIFLSIGNLEEVDLPVEKGLRLLKFDKVHEQQFSCAFDFPSKSRVAPLQSIFSSSLSTYIRKRECWKELMHQKLDEEKGYSSEWRKWEKSVVLSPTHDVMSMPPRKIVSSASTSSVAAGLASLLVTS